MFFFIFFKKCNIVNIKTILFFIGPLQQFFNKYLFFKFISKYQKEIQRCDFFSEMFQSLHFHRESDLDVFESKFPVLLCRQNLVICELCLVHSAKKTSQYLFRGGGLGLDCNFHD